MSSLKNIVACLSSAAAGGTVVATTTGSGKLAFPAWAAIAIVAIIIVGLVIIIYRLTDKADPVALVKAWKSSSVRIDDVKVPVKVASTIKQNIAVIAEPQDSVEDRMVA